MTENMKEWLTELYESEAEAHDKTAQFEHLCALGAPTDEASTLHEMNADEHRAFARLLRSMIIKIEEEKLI